MVINGKTIVITKNKDIVCGYNVYAIENGHAETWYVRGTNDGRGYFRVYFGTSGQYHKGEVKQFAYLHKLVFAYYCGWNTMDIQEGFDVHHINFDDEYKKNSHNYNDFSNLVYINRKDHRALHSAFKKALAIMEKEPSEVTEEDYENLVKYRQITADILNKAITIRDRTAKKTGLFEKADNLGEQLTRLNQLYALKHMAKDDKNGKN